MSVLAMVSLAGFVLAAYAILSAIAYGIIGQAVPELRLTAPELHLASAVLWPAIAFVGLVILVGYWIGYRLILKPWHENILVPIAGWSAGLFASKDRS